MDPLNLATLPKYLSNEASAWELLERLRWPQGQIVCPHCGVIDPQHYFIAARSGERTTRTGQTTYRRLWKCRDKDCRRQFSVLVGTIFESSKIPVSKWLLAMWLMGAGKNGVSALELQRHLGIAYQSAWFMAHRLREAMRREPLAALITGKVVVADETWIGGAPKNMHAHKRPMRGKGFSDQTPVLSLISMGLDESEVRSRVVPNVRGATLRAAIEEQVDLPNTTLFTDSSKAYTELTPKVARHVSVNHSKGEYVKRGAGTNAAESYFSQLKRSLDGTFHHVSKEHLPRYLAEFDFRYNTRKMTDSERVQSLVDKTVGKRLTYRPLTGR
jgi:transposase-like protein